MFVYGKVVNKFLHQKVKVVYKLLEMSAVDGGIQMINTLSDNQMMHNGSEDSQLYDSNEVDETNHDKEIEIIDSYQTEEELEEYIRLREGKQNNNNNNIILNENEEKKEEIEEENKEISWSKDKLNSSSVGSLLRFFQSQFFDTWISVSYLYRYPSPGIHDYLCNALYSMPDDEIEFYLVQLWYLLSLL